VLNQYQVELSRVMLDDMYKRESPLPRTNWIPSGLSPVTTTALIKPATVGAV
jgi:hypothetical protein